MNGKPFELKEIFTYCLVPLALYFLFKNFVDNTILKFVVKNILSSCYPGNLRLDVTTIFLLIVNLVYLGFKRFKGAILSWKSIYLLINYFIIYLLYRTVENRFEFTAFSFAAGFKLLDATALVSSVAVILSLIPPHKLNVNIDKTLGFTVDEAIKIDDNNDLLNRSKFIEEIATKIINTDTPNGSFPIGLIAAWGSGKTTFLNTLSSDLERSNPEIIRIDFNAWKCTTPSQVIETFFKQLKGKFSKFSFTVEGKIQDYISNLVKGTKNEGFNSFKNILESIFPTPSIEKQYEIVNNEIKRIGKKIVVFIDDLDRLDKKEIYEVIRLIRNTANFSNTFYIVAYDRNYLLSAIEDINAYLAHQFLEKIFQVEFALPPIESQILQKEITKYIVPSLNDTDHIEYLSLIHSKASFYNRDFIPNLAILFISNIRDVVRFANSFKLNYQFVKGEVSFKDFYNLEIIRFKNPELFIEIYRNKGEFLSYEKEPNSLNSDYIHFLKRIKTENGEDSKTLELENFLTDNSKIYKLSENEIKLIIKAYHSIFPIKGDFLYQSEINYPLLSVVRPSMYDRYFLLGIEGRLSQLEFSQIRALPQAKMAERLNILIDKGLESEVLERLEKIDSFDSKKDFEKIVINIFHVANITLLEKGYYGFGNYLGYNGNILSSLLSKTKIIELYSGLPQYKSFLKSVLATDQDEFTYTNQYLNSLFKDNFYTIGNILTLDEIIELSFENFRKAVNTSIKLTKGLWWHFIHCITRQETHHNNGSYSISNPIVEPAKKLMQDFILKHDIDGIIRLSISPTHFSKKLKLENYIATVFNSDENFVALLKTTNTTSIYKEEFLRFYEDLKTNDIFKKEGVPPSYFKTIPITEQIWD